MAKQILLIALILIVVGGGLFMGLKYFHDKKTKEEVTEKTSTPETIK